MRQKYTLVPSHQLQATERIALPFVKRAPPLNQVFDELSCIIAGAFCQSPPLLEFHAHKCLTKAVFAFLLVLCWRFAWLQLPDRLQRTLARRLRPGRKHFFVWSLQRMALTIADVSILSFPAQCNSSQVRGGSAKRITKMSAVPQGCMRCDTIVSLVYLLAG